METLKGTLLTDKISVSRLVSAFFYKLPENFGYSGESHSGWEFVYVENGSISVGADKMTYILKKGEMVCHKPFEFHTVKPCDNNSSVIIFCCLSHLISAPLISPKVTTPPRLTDCV